MAFVRSRRSAETIALATRGRLRTHDPVRAERVASYRGGYLAEDRRVVERALTRGDLLAVAATNALELGVDITGLDAVVLAGFPGTRASLWQQVGRAGRRGQDAVAVLVAGADPLDQYLVSHPELLFSAGLEATSFDPDNPYVVAPHLAAAAAELPLTPADLTVFGAHAPRLVDELASAGLLRRRTAGWFWARRSRASDLTDIRGEGAAQVTIVEVGTGRLIGTVDAHSADTTVHDGAVYLHQGETFLVLGYDLRAGVAIVRPAPSLGYTTAPRVQSSVTIRRVRQEQGWGAAHVHFGDVRVTAQAVGYLRRRSGSGEVIGEVALDLPERHLDTSSVWFTLDPDAVARSGIVPGAVAGAAHAAEHAAISLLPLVASCDRWDVGGLSIREHPQTGTVTVFVHDGLPGGAGLAERAFGTADHWLAATRTAIATCRCEDGCPSCVQSPKCGNGNNPLDKQAAVHLLDAVLADAPAAGPHRHRVSCPSTSVGRIDPPVADRRTVMIVVGVVLLVLALIAAIGVFAGGTAFFTLAVGSITWATNSAQIFLTGAAVMLVLLAGAQVTWIGWKRQHRQHKDVRSLRRSAEAAGITVGDLPRASPRNPPPSRRRRRPTASPVAGSTTRLIRVRPLRDRPLRARAAHVAGEADHEPTSRPDPGDEIRTRPLERGHRGDTER